MPNDKVKTTDSPVDAARSQEKPYASKVLPRLTEVFKSRCSVASEDCNLFHRFQRLASKCRAFCSTKGAPSGSDSDSDQEKIVQINAGRRKIIDKRRSGWPPSTCRG